MAWTVGMLLMSGRGCRMSQGALRPIFMTCSTIASASTQTNAASLVSIYSCFGCELPRRSLLQSPGRACICMPGTAMPCCFMRLHLLVPQTLPLGLSMPSLHLPLPAKVQHACKKRQVQTSALASPADHALAQLPAFRPTCVVVMQTLLNVADTHIALGEAQAEAGQLQAGQAAFQAGIAAYAEACGLCSSEAGDDLPGLLHNWGVGLHTWATHTQVGA